MAHPWDPPADASGGFFVLQYSNGVYTHRQRLHVLPFNASTLAYTSPPGSEANVPATIGAWENIWEAFYGTAWSISVLSIWQIVSGVPVLLPTVPTVTATGTVTTGSEAKLPSGEVIFNFRTTLGNRARIVFIAPRNWDVTDPQVVNPGSTAPFGTLMTYITGANTAIVAHDGSKLPGTAKVTQPYNRRLRRRYRED